MNEQSVYNGGLFLFYHWVFLKLSKNLTNGIKRCMIVVNTLKS